MKKTILAARVLNVFRSMVPRGFYNKLRGHTGVDLDFKIGDTLLSPVSGKVVKTSIQNEMGKTLYLLHEATGDVWVFAHNTKFLHAVGDHVERLDELVITGNTGSKSTAPHSHVEVITKEPLTSVEDGGAEINKIMSRSLNGFSGFNCDPIKRLLALYKKFGIDPANRRSS